MLKKKILTVAVLLAIIATIVSGCMPAGQNTDKNISILDESEYKFSTPTLTVDMSAETGDILHGASGFL